MLTGPSVLSFAAIGLYALVIASCSFAAVTSTGRRQQDWHFNAWAALALLFAVLLAMRLFEVEELLRMQLRDNLRADASYADRREWQRPVVAGVVALSGAAAFVALFRVSRTVRGRRNFAILAAGGAGIAMLGLVLLRMVSLHPVDRLLYGPLKLNWFGDIGLSLFVLGAALLYIRIVRRS